METLLIVALGALALLTGILYACGRRHHWGVAPVGLLGFGLVIPIGMLLIGVL